MDYVLEILVNIIKVNKIMNNPIEPNHYIDLVISLLEYITENEGEFTWCIANVIKYVSRYKRKNGIEDLQKAQWYLNYQIKIEEKNVKNSYWCRYG